MYDICIEISYEPIHKVIIFFALYEFHNCQPQV